MTDTCPVCHRSAAYDHIACVKQLVADRDRYRALFRKANTARRQAELDRADAERDRDDAAIGAWKMGADWLDARRKADRYRDLFRKANKAKREFRDIALEYRVDFYNMENRIQKGY